MSFNSIPIKELKGVGPKKEALFNRLGIYNTEDLLRYYPATYQDLRNPKEISLLEDKQTALIHGKVSLMIGGKSRNKRSPISLLVEDKSGKIEVVFFNAAYIKNIVKTRENYFFFGKVKILNGKKQMINPEIYDSKSFKKEILPIYTNIKGISQNDIRKHVRELLEGDIDDFIPEEIIKRQKLCPLDFCLKNLHFPIDKQHLKIAKYRQIYEELLILELGLEMMRVKKTDGIPMEGFCEEFIESFPFKLTEGQNKATVEILNDMSHNSPMNRLLQGDVGSGKTAVASIAMYKAATNGYQAAFMAPTEILAKQHYINLKKQFEKFNINVGLITGSMKTAEKREALAKTSDGTYQIVIGTHALIQDKVTFDKLGLVITDEQHRFGVNQRFTLGSKGSQPHILVMTATPIPRTLAVILYGDLDVSIINSLPSGRKEIKTVEISESQRLKLYDDLIKPIKEGGQVYIVAPLIEESETMENVKSVESLYDELSKLYKPYGIRLSILHGAMKQKEKDEIMQSFNRGEIDMLIATVVIEVGINVPNATVMVIENAERFGLAQLHQLRGRVGRGDKQSYCYLVNMGKGDVAQKRMSIMCQSTDGFYISEEDLKLRGPGEVFGVRQHGIPDVSLANAVKHYDILQKAKEDAKICVDIKDDNVKESLLKRVKKMYGDNLTIQL